MTTILLDKSFNVMIDNNPIESGKTYKINMIKSSKITLTYPFQNNYYYTIFMIDDSVSLKKYDNNCYFVHWIVQNITTSNLNGRVILPYIPPNLLMNNEKGTYYIFVLKSKTPALIIPPKNRIKFNICKFIDHNRFMFDKMIYFNLIACV